MSLDPLTARLRCARADRSLRIAMRTALDTTGDDFGDIDLNRIEAAIAERTLARGYLAIAADTLGERAWSPR